MNYEKLKQLIEEAPEGLSDEQLFNWLTEPSQEVLVEKFVTTRSLMAELGPALADQILTKLEQIAESNSLIGRVVLMMRPSEGGIDLGNEATIASLAALQQGGVLLPEEVEALISLARKEVSLAELHNLSGVRVGDVIFARTL